MSILYTGQAGAGLNTGFASSNSGGGGSGPSYPLLTGLVGWALTGGPQQTLSSAGVIASGPEDLTAVGTVTYSAAGADFDSEEGLQKAGDNALSTGPVSFGFEAWIDLDPIDTSSAYQAFILYKFNESDDDYLIKAYGNGVDTGVIEFEISDGGGYPTLDVPVTDAVLLAKMQIIAWVDIDALTMNVAINGGSVNSLAIDGDQAVLAGGFFVLGSYPVEGVSNGMIGKQGPTRFWNNPSDIAATLGNATVRTWLYNSGNGRTDAEIAAYTG